jgi:hypothetical protein
MCNESRKRMSETLPKAELEDLFLILRIGIQWVGDTQGKRTDRRQPLRRKPGGVAQLTEIEACWRDQIGALRPPDVTEVQEEPQTYCLFKLASNRRRREQLEPAGQLQVTTNGII